jgi:ComF family protein
VYDAAGAFCPECALGLEAMGGARCGVCGEPGEFTRERCPRCELHPPPFDQAISPYHHDGPLARAIHRFKYEDHPELARPLGLLLAEALTHPVHPERSAARGQSKPVLSEVEGGQNFSTYSLCAIPLHKTRYAQRLYDQAELLAVEVSKALKLPHLGALERVRATTRQVGLSEAEREANVRDAFRAVTDVKGRDLLLVDDVLTTGATARAAAGALKVAGANRVVLLTVARAATSRDAVTG